MSSTHTHASSDSKSHGSHAPGSHEHGEGSHAVSLWILIGVYVALLILTAVTYAASLVDLGFANIIVALAIAVLKAALVALFFMHLFWDSPFNAFVILCALFFVAWFIGVAMLDVHTYSPSFKITPTQSLTK